MQSGKADLSPLQNRSVTVPKLFDELAPRFANRQGGYTRIQRIGNRYGDNAPMAVIEYIDGPNDLKREMVSKVLDRLSSEKGSTITVEDALKGDLSVFPKKLVRDLKKIQFANSIKTQASS